MKRSGDDKLIQLRAASRDADAAAVASLWRELTPREQEDVVFTLLGMPNQDPAETTTAEPVEQTDPGMPRVDETAALDALEQTVMTPKLVEDLRGLSGSENDPSEFHEGPADPQGPTSYRSRWLQRWKWSMLVGAWAVTTIFAFTANVSTFGPMEWFVALFASVVGGGLLVGTLLNFAVAAIPTQASAALHGDQPERPA